MNPYKIGNTVLDFGRFGDCLKLTKEKKRRRERDVIKICFIFATGRARLSAHTGFTTDAINVPEITAGLVNWCHQNNFDLEVKSEFDIDINAKIKNEWNLFIFGSGNINLMTREYQNEFIGDLKVRFETHYDIFIYDSITRDQYTGCDPTAQNCGMLTMTYNPWAKQKEKNRIIILVAGLHAVGTIAASSYLANCIIKGVGGNHLNDGNIPAKILRPTTKRYRNLLESPPGYTRYIGGITDITVIK